jgi:hypothetical protein
MARVSLNSCPNLPVTDRVSKHSLLILNTTSIFFKGTVFRTRSMNIYKENGRIGLLLLNLDTIWRWVLSLTLRPLYRWERCRGSHCIGGWEVWQYWRPSAPHEITGFRTKDPFPEGYSLRWFAAATWKWVDVPSGWIMSSSSIWGSSREVVTYGQGLPMTVFTMKRKVAWTFSFEMAQNRNHFFCIEFCSPKTENMPINFIFDVRSRRLFTEVNLAGQVFFVLRHG